MKKRTLVCFLIFTLCVFYTAIPNTVFGQEEDASLAEQVFDRYKETLQDDDVQSVLPEVLEALSDPATLQNPIITTLGGFDAAIDLLLGNPALITTIVPDAGPEVITLLGTPAIQTMFKDPDVRTLLQDTEAVKELAALLAAGAEPPDEVTTPPDEVTTPPDEVTTPPDTVFGQEEDASLAEQVFDRYKETLQDDDVQSVLPEVLEALSDPATLQNPIITTLGGFDAAIDLLLGNPALITTIVPDAGPEVITLLGTPAIQTMFKDPDVRTLLQDTEAVKELAALLAAGAEPPDEVTTPPDEVTTPLGDGTSTPPGDGTTPPDEVTTPPGDGTTPPGDGTTPPGDGAISPPAEPIVPLADPIMPTNLTGLSRLGGLSLNRVNVRQIVDFAGETAEAAGFPLAPEAVASVLAGFVPKGFFPTDQIERVLLDERFPILRQEAKQLDYENFGNAITPNFADFAYNDYGKRPTDKYLTRDSLHLYMRVPMNDEGTGVNFYLTDTSGNVEPYAADEITTEEFQADTFSYTFRLEETLAAANLPAWASLNTQLFSSVTLRWSAEPNAPIPESDPMLPMTMENGGVVWEAVVDIPADRENTYYYFEVELVDELTFTTLDRDAISMMLENPDPLTFENIINATTENTIKSWAMPDPRNLQLVDRGLTRQLVTPDLLSTIAEIEIDFSKFLEGDILDLLTPKQSEKIRNILLRNTRDLISRFEEDHDPMVASVFSVPKVNLEKHSLWVVYIQDLDDDKYNLEVIVHDAEGNALDQIQEQFTVDKSAPEATIEIDEMAPGLNATGYWNDDGIFVATAPDPGAATLSITANLTDPSQIGPTSGIGPAKGYLFYQMVGLNADGTPYAGEASLERPNTWMPLTVQSTMLTSRVWDAIREAVNGGRVELPPALESNANLQLALGFDLETILGLLSTDLVRVEVDKFVASLESFTGFDKLNDTQYQLIVNALGDTIDIIDNLVPVRFDASPVVMPIQGPGMPLLVGDYGIRAMGIDTLFNVGAYATPTHLRIVDPSISVDSASIMNANIGDFNNDSVVHPVYETGIIYANTENVMITGAIENPTGHPIESVKIQYLAPSGGWQTIGEAVLTSASAFEFDWKVTDFDALIGAGDTVMVRAVATNALQLTDAEPMAFSIELDAGVYPPEVLSLEVDDVSIMSRNPDSYAPQGTVTINASTLPLTGPRTVAVRFEATQGDGAPIPLGTATQSGDAGLVAAVATAVGVAAEGTAAPINSGDRKWSIPVDTTTLADTITKDSAGARDVLLDDNQYTVRAFAVSADGREWPSDAMTMFSVDNVDDVAPLGPTNIVAIANAGGAVETNPDGSYNVGGLIDAHDPSVVSPIATFTIEPTADKKTYASVKLVQTAADGTQTEIPAEVGVLEITIDVGALGIPGNGAYTLHALAVDEFGNVQTDESPEITVHVRNYLRPDPGVFKITVDAATKMNPDSGGPQGMLTFRGYTLEQNSPPIRSIGLEAKREGDTAWQTIGTANTSKAVVIEGEALPGVLDYLTDIAVEGTQAGDRSTVAIDKTNQEWLVSVDTTTLADSIVVGSKGERDVSMDDNPYTVRAFAIDGSGKEWSSEATAMFSVDNVDDVAPLGPTNVSVTRVDATDNSVFEDAGDGSYTVGGLVDKHDDAVASPVATLTLEPTAARKTYDSVTLVPDTEGLVVTEVAETSVGSGVFTVTVDVGTLADGEYLENGIYMFHALAFDEFGNVQADMSETDGSRISVTVANTYRPAPQVLAFTVGDPTQTNPDSGAPQGTIALYGYSPEITSAPTTSVRIEVKRESDTEWIDVGTASESSPVTAADDAKFAAAKVADVAGENVVTSDTYQRWMIEVDTTTLEDSITADSPGARDASKDDNQYMVRATAIAAVDGSETLSAEGVTAMFSVDNVDDVAPLGPTNVSVTSVEATDSVFETAEDGSYTVGGLVDKYDEAVVSPVATLTIEPTADRKTYKSVRFVPDIENLVVTEVTETGEGSGVFTVTVDVGTLADMKTYLENGTYMFYALAFDEFGNEQADDSETDGSKISVTVENSYRPAPEVLAIAVDPESITQMNPDSGAPQGSITIKAYSHEISSPPTNAVRIEVKRPGDPEWIGVGTATESVATTEVSDANLTDFVGYLANVAVSTAEANESVGETVVAINRTYQQWMIAVDTTTLEDTITAASPAARDASKDNNQYMVRAVAIAEADGSETISADGVTAMFSVDNVDDVPPVGPTNIVAVADVAGAIVANEDGSYTVGGIADDTVPTPIAIFTTEPTADPITYASVNLVQTAEDSTETITMGEAGVLDVTIDVGMLENGAYTFHALAVDEFGNVQTDESLQITVHVLNFRVADVSDLVVIAVDGTDVAESPAEPIPLRESVTVSFMVANDSLAADELSGAVHGSEVLNESAEDPENTFTLKVEVGGLADGVYTPDGVVTKRNGSVAFPLTTVNVDNTGPMVTIESPTEDETVDSLPTIRATYHDGAGSGVDGATGSLALARLQPPNEVEVVVDQAELEKDAANLVYTRSEELAGGAYRVTVQVTDNLGNVGEGSAEFAVNGTLPTVAIHSPASGQTFKHGEPLISGEFSGAGTVEVTTFTVNDVDATPEVNGNRFSYTPEAALANGNYTVVVAVTDGDGNTAQTSVTFMVDIPEPPKDTTPPVISTVAPSGLIKLATHGDVITLSAVVTDEQSDIASVRFSINDGPSRSVSAAHIKAGEISISQLLEPGQYTADVVATSRGGTTKHSWVFTLVFDDVKPTITSITPSGTIRGGLPVISASANDESGVGEMTITVMDSDGEEVNGKSADDGEENVEGITRLDFNPEAPLEEGTYTIEVRATDTIGNSSTAKGTFTIDFDTAAPVVTMASPQNEARLTNRRPQISITYADAESGIDVDSIRFVFDDKLINLALNQKSASQVIYTPSADLAFGQHTVKLEVSDMAHKEGNVSEKSDGARKSNMAVHEFSFTVESEEGPVLASRPINAPNPFKENTRISFTLTRQSTVSIVIYDSTLRPVRVLVDNEVWDAGEYIGKAAIGWDGTTTGGEALARGIYFCEIIVADGFEPEYAILKLALTR